MVFFMYINIANRTGLIKIAVQNVYIIHHIPVRWNYKVAQMESNVAFEMYGRSMSKQIEKKMGNESNGLFYGLSFGSCTHTRCTRKMVQCILDIAYGPSQDAILRIVRGANVVRGKHWTAPGKIPITSTTEHKHNSALLIGKSLMHFVQDLRVFIECRNVVLWCLFRNL